MPEFLQKLAGNGQAVPLDVLVLRLILALLAGAAVAWLYRRTRRCVGGDSLPPTLVLLAVLIAAVTQVIGDNVARAFSLVGALSIVRFRTVVRDTRDTAFVIFSVVVGMGMGAGNTLVAFTTVAMGGLAAWLMARSRWWQSAATEFELKVRVALGQDPALLERDTFPQVLASWNSSGAGTARQGSALEVVWIVTLQPRVSPAEVIRTLNRVEGVQSAELGPTDFVG